MTRFFITATELAEITGEHKETILKRTRAGFYKGAIGGGPGKAYRYQIEKTEKQLGLTPGTIKQALAEAKAETAAA